MYILVAMDCNYNIRLKTHLGQKTSALLENAVKWLPIKNEFGFSELMWICNECNESTQRKYTTPALYLTASINADNLSCWNCSKMLMPKPTLLSDVIVNANT